MEEAIQDALRELDAITVKLGRMGSSEPLSRRNGMEANYGQTYQRLVRLGVRHQLRMKYRFSA
jgi:hypothetical protein